MYYQQPQQYQQAGASRTQRHHCVKTRVMQKHIHDVKNSAAHFARAEGNAEKPIVLVPDGFSCCALCITIPDGFWILAQKWLSDQGAPNPGFKWCWPFWWRVSHVVTKKGISYNHPVANCPTSDNVMVEVDVSLIFQIGPSLDDAKKFVYELGAHRFDEMLSAETEEAIRALVNRVPVMKVLDLREEFAVGMRDGLNSTLAPYGVQIKNVKITNVLLPIELETTLQNRTSFKTKMEQQEKKHSADMRKVNDTAKQALTQIKKNNKRKVQDLVAETERALIGREEQLTSINTKKMVQMVDAKSRAQVAEVKANNMKEVAAQEGEQKFTEMVLRVSAATKAKQIEAEQDFHNRKVRAEAALAVAKNEASEKVADAEAEKKAASELQEKRDFIVQSLRMNVMTGMAKNSALVVCGDAGEKFLQTMAPGSKADLSRSLGTFKKA